MKKLLVGCAISLVAGAAFAEVSKKEAQRLNEAATVLNELRGTPDKGVPESLWLKAECALVIPSVKKGAFLVGGEYGAGVMSCRTSNRNEWTAPIFMQLSKGSIGFQIGGESMDLVLLVMNRRGAEKLLQDKVSLGADASVAAGPAGRAADAATDAQMHAEILSYSRAEGVFAGIDLSGGALKPDKDADERAYGKGVNARDIALGAKPVPPPTEAATFMRALRTEAKATTGHK
jgi:lipid-binding SYLF domain-containing protein